MHWKSSMKMVAVDDRSIQALTALGATLAGLGGAALLVLLTASGEFPWWTWALSWAGLGIGLLILLTEAVPRLHRLVSAPLHRYERGSGQKPGFERLGIGKTSLQRPRARIRGDRSVYP
jgi:hypothetical protein